MKKDSNSGLLKTFTPKNGPWNSWSPDFRTTIWKQKSQNAGTKSFPSVQFRRKSNIWVDILIRCFDITNHWGCLGHSSSRNLREIQGKYHNCLCRISNCHHIQHLSRNLLPLPHISGSLCSNLVLHFHQHIL